MIPKGYKVGDLKNEAKKTSLTIMKWAISCETPEQLENIKKFINRTKLFLSNQIEISDVRFYYGTLLGCILTCEKKLTKL